MDPVPALAPRYKAPVCAHAGFWVGKVKSDDEDEEEEVCEAK